MQKTNFDVKRAAALKKVQVERAKALKAAKAAAASVPKTPPAEDISVREILSMNQVA